MVQVGFVSDEELNAEALVFEDSGDTFEIQRSLGFDDQDRHLGMDTYCLVSNGGPCIYGGVGSWELTATQLTVRFTTDAVITLGVDPRSSSTSTAQPSSVNTSAGYWHKPVPEPEGLFDDAELFNRPAPDRADTDSDPASFGSLGYCTDCWNTYITNGVYPPSRIGPTQPQGR